MWFGEGVCHILKWGLNQYSELVSGILGLGMVILYSSIRYISSS